MLQSIREIVSDPRLTALTYRQPLEPVEGREAPVFAPTYPPHKDRKVHRFDTPYTVNETASGVRMCDLDSVPSQANRMERAFTGALADVVPHHVVEAGTRRIDLTRLPHRLADAAIRATALVGEIRRCFEAVESGDPEPMARIAPTTLVYGAWDSRDTQVRLPRAIGSTIRAFDVCVLTRSAQYTGAFGRAALGLSDQEWKKGAEAGFAPTPSVDAPGGILVNGEIVQSASVMLNVLRRYRTGDDAALLPAWLLGLALGALLTAGREYSLRSGCALVPAGPGQWTSVSVSGERARIELDAEAVVAELREVAGEWAASAGVTLGGAPTVHRYDETVARQMLKAAAKSTPAAGEAS